MLVHSNVEAQGLKLNYKLLECRLSLSLVKFTIFKILHKILLRVIALKVSELDRLSHVSKKMFDPTCLPAHPIINEHSLISKPRVQNISSGHFKYSPHSEEWIQRKPS